MESQDKNEKKQTTKKKSTEKSKAYVKSYEKIEDAKEIIKEQKKIIKVEKQSIKNKKFGKFKKTKFGKMLGKVCFIFDDEKNSYSFSEIIGVTIVSLLVGAFACFSVFTILSGGRNYFRLLKKLDKFYDVYDVITSNYNGNIDEDKLIESAISGMVSSVGDVYTNYNDIETTGEFEQMVSGTYEGIGCTILQTEDTIKVMDVYDKSPAAKTGILVGDVIKTVDGQETIKLGTQKLANYIKNEAKGKIEMVIVRDGKEMTVTLERAKVEMPTVTKEVYEKNDKKIGYISISIFSSVTAKQFEKALNDLEKDGIDGLVIDVRENSGGYLSSVTDITSLFLPRGKVIYQIQIDNKKKVTKDKTIEKREYPIAVLTNNGSASASEILAAAIKESYNGHIVGTKTFGKGTVQQVKKLKDGSMIKYTVENWLTPNGNWINDNGIEPTTVVEMNNEYYEDPKTENDNQLQRALELISE